MERKFVKSRKAQKAADLRVSANVSIQETKTQVLPDLSLVEVGNYEETAEKQCAKLKEQWQKELISFPKDDFQWVRKKRLLSTNVNPTVVTPELLEVEAPFVKECVEFYRSDYSSLQFKHANLSGSYFALLHDSRAIEGVDEQTTSDSNKESMAHLFTVLPTQRFELDVENSANTSQQVSNLVKQGYLWKTPFNRKGEKSFFTKNSFKKRFFSLQQLPDGSYALNYWKDEKKDVMKGCLNLEGCLSSSKLPSSKTSSLGFSSGYSSAGSSSSGKHVIELHFVNKQVLQVAADSESEQEDWLNVLQRAILVSNSLDTHSCSNQSVGTADDDSYNSDFSDLSTEVQVQQPYHTTTSRSKSVSSSSASGGGKHPAPAAPGSTRDPALGSDIQRFCKETDRSVAEARRKDRLSLFSVYADFDCEEGSHLEIEDNAKFYRSEDLKAPFVESNVKLKEVLVTLEKLDFPLKVAQDGTKQYNMEPFFTSISLYDVTNGVKLSEDVWLDGNPGPVWKMVKHDIDSLLTSNMTQSLTSIPAQSINDRNPIYNVHGSRQNVVDNPLVNNLKEVVFSIPDEIPLDNLFIYVRVEKVLQGAISSSFEVYGKTGIDQEHKIVQKYIKQLHMFCQKFGSRFRTPFCWAAVPVPTVLSSNFADEAKGVHRVTSPLVKIDQSKLNSECLKRNIVDAKAYLDRPEKFSNRFGVLPDANIVFTFQNMSDVKSGKIDIVNPFLLQKTGMPESDNSKDSTKRVAKEAYLFRTFSYWTENPYTEYVNAMFINQIRLKFDSQKVFAKARNIACNVRFFGDDSCQSPPLTCIYSPVLGQNISFTDQYMTAISHHNTNPDFQDEIKIELPAELTPKHHVLFTFYHISCDQVSKLTTSSATVGKKSGSGIASLESNVGYAWITVGTILEKASFRDSSGTLEFSTSVPVAASVAPGYLSMDNEDPSSLVQSEVNLHSGQKLDRIKFLDGGKNLFSFACKIKSTVLPHSKFLKNLFEHSTKTVDIETSSTNSCLSESASQSKSEEGGDDSPSRESMASAATVIAAGTGVSGSEVVTSPTVTHEKVVKGADVLQHIKAAHAVDENELVAYLPVILNKLLHLITRTNSDVQINIMRFLVHIATTLERIGRIQLLTQYTRHIFLSTRVYSTSANSALSGGERTVHYRVISSLVSLLSFTSGDEFFFRHLLYFMFVFFDITLKSMAHAVLTQQKLKIPRGVWFTELYHDTLSQMVTSLSQQILDRNSTNFKETLIANRSLAFFLKNLLSLMDRGKVFNLIKSYWMIFGHLNLADGKGVVKLRIEFLQIMSSHEHFVALCMPVFAKKSTFGTIWSKDFTREFTLSEELFAQHFPSALLLGEVSLDLQDVPKVRSASIALLRDVLAKLSADSRYATEQNQAIVTSLFVPLFGIVVQNVNRLSLLNSSCSGQRPLSRSVSTESISELALMASGGGSEQSQKTSSVAFSSSVEAANSRKSSSSTVRFDTLDVQEIRNLLLCFLHVLKHCTTSSSSSSTNGSSGGNGSVSGGGAGGSDSILTHWWDSSGTEEHQSAFLQTLKICLDCFQYDPNKKWLKRLSRHLSFNCNKSPWLEDAAQFMINSNGKLSSVKEASHPNAPVGANMSASCREKSVNANFGEGVNERALGGSQFPITASSGCGSHVRPKTIALTCTSTGSNLEDGTVSDVINSSGGQWSVMAVGGGASSIEASGSVLSSLKEANLATETGLVVLDTVDALANHFRKRQEALQSGSVALLNLFEIYLGFLRANHSETLLQQAFASMRLLNSKFPMMLFKGDPSLCGRMCFELIRCFSARLESTRYHSCMLLYLLMRNNFIFTGRQNCTRVHLQSIVAVSQLVGDVAAGTTSPRFQDSLALLNNLSASDRGMTHTKLPGMVNEVTKTIRKVLIATSQMKEHAEEPEMLIHLQHSLADSYAGTPALRQTWLESMAKIHSSSGYHSEAAMCYLHIAAMHAEYLKALGQPLVNPLSTANVKSTTFSNKKISISASATANADLSSLTISPYLSERSGVGSTGTMSRLHSQNQPSGTAVNNFANSLIPTGKSLFKEISANIEGNETAIVEDKGGNQAQSQQQDDSFSQEIFVKLLETALEHIWQSQRFEIVPRVVQLILPFYDRQRNYERLVELHQQCSKAYTKMMEVYASGKRFLASYFRIAFFGKIFGSEDGQQYIYKEPNVTSLAVVSERLSRLYVDRLGQENFKLLHDSQVDAKTLDTKIGFLQITHVEPYWEECEQTTTDPLPSSTAANSFTDFDVHNNVNKFVFEAPFTRPADGLGSSGGGGDVNRHASQLNEQYIRKTILRTKQSFPYVEKRIIVDMVQSFELSPIEVAIESLKKMIKELKVILGKKQPDMKRLQLKLQGCVGTQVNAGPMAYARAFLEAERQYAYPANKVKELKHIYIDFVATCADALDLNGRLIKSDQFEFQENLKLSFKLLVEKLATILNMNITDKGTIEWSNQSSATPVLPAVMTSTDSPHMRNKSNKAMPSSTTASGTQSSAATGSHSTYTSDSRRNSTKILSEISKTSNS
ncbi:dedicator of cytokinesis protein 11-like isoform X2 [Convolutriloba macropyga]|uniref:dedicator of cytokinesis protein 11-like isoform X2 n=1 Tax=Convolutriloba macropyga TaxID=536237 RepID=UPI003F52323F